MPKPETAPETKAYTLVAGGDVVPGAFMSPYLRRSGPDYPYSGVAPFFQSADIGLINLECPLSERGRPFKKKYTFRASPDSAPALRRAGINAVSLANNHTLDYGPDALLDTLDALAQAGIVAAGAGAQATSARQPGRLDIPDGPTIALLSYSLTYPAEFWAGPHTPGTALARIPVVESDVRAATAWADMVVVCFHWGGELMPLPRPYQTEYGRAAIDAGARVVVGTHPHILQGIEWYGRGLILYSLGNLAFGGGRSRDAVDSALVKISFNRTGEIQGAWILPLSVDNRATQFVPTPVKGSPAQSIVQMIQERSNAWGTQLAWQDDADWLPILPTRPKTAGTPAPAVP